MTSIAPAVVLRTAGSNEPRRPGSRDVLATGNPLTPGRSTPRAKIVGEDLQATPAQLAAVVRPGPLTPVAKITRFRQEQVIQGVAVGLAVFVDRAAVKRLVEAGAELLHRLEQVFVT